jgi:transposase
MLSSSRDEPGADRVRSMVSSPTVMSTIACNTEGLQFVHVLAKGATCDTYCYCEDILSEILSACPVRSNGRLVVHAGNAGPHSSKRTREFMEENNTKRALHPPFSPDLAPFDFLLFGYIKRTLQGIEFTEKDDLLAKIREIVKGTSGTALKVVFIQWEKRMQICTDAESQYVE